MTEFSQKVYETVRQIPKGQTLSYKGVAKKAGSPKAWRAVGTILRKNHNSVIPCHRVIKSNWEPGSFNKGRKEKELLLRAERAVVDKGKNIKYTITHKLGYNH